MFEHESAFEKALIAVLQTKGWEQQVLISPTHQQLLDNWASILFANNRGIDRMNDVPLTQGEMQQIMEQIAYLHTPLGLNGFINGKTVTIKRDNPLDSLHLGREVSLKIYDRQEIAAGQSRYQIAQQVPLLRGAPLTHDRRSDLLLLINGMPVIHIELKRSGIPVYQACNQIEKYAHEGLFTGLFSLVQIFVAMEPAETLYFANPGPDGKFNRDYYFHWADFNNDPINAWDRIATDLLSIPMAHQLIGFYTVADTADGVLKVMRSYQYYAANAISVRVAKRDWEDRSQLGGYIWHTTGSGRTMTSFKSAQLIANSNDADKVVFLMDRIELGSQSLDKYRAYADDSDDVQATESTHTLISKLKSSDPKQTLIVTSIQKMSNIKHEESGLYAYDIEQMTSNDDMVVGYDLLNEPVCANDNDVKALNALYRETVAAIRQVDPHHIIFLEGDQWSIDFSKMDAPFDVSVKQKGTGSLLHGYSLAQKRAGIVQARPGRSGYFCSAHVRKHMQDN